MASSPRGKNPRETGKQVAIEAMKNAGKTEKPKYFYMVASPAEEEEYIKGIQEVIGMVPVFGGSAADNTVEGKWSIYTNDKVLTMSCSSIFLYR